MNLKFELKEKTMQALCLKDTEEIKYAVPIDLAYDVNGKAVVEEYGNDLFFVATDRRIVVMNGENPAFSEDVKNIEKVKCEHMVGCGIITVTYNDGLEKCIARVSMKQIERAAYAIRGAQAIVKAVRNKKSADKAEKITSTEYEKYCPRCGRALPGTSKCPYCDGKTDLVKKFFALCGEYVGKFMLISLIMLLITGVDVVKPMVQRWFVDEQLYNGSGTWKGLIFFVLVSALMLVVTVFLQVWKNLNAAKLGSLLSMSLREKLYYKLQILSLSFINKRKTGELMNRISGDTNTVRNFFQDVFGDMVSVLFTMLVSLIVMITISPIMTLIEFGFVAVSFVIMRAFRHRIHLRYHRQWLKNDALSNNIQDVISGMRVVKTYGTEERESKRFSEKSMDYANVEVRNERFWAILFPIITFLIGLGTYIAVYMGGNRVLFGHMTMGQLLQFLTYSGYLFGPLNWMTHLPRMIIQMVTSLNRIYDVLDEEPRIKDGKDSRKVDIKGEFRFDNVSFGYNTYEPVLEDVSFDVKPGEMIGLVGASGTGKSTMINLIMRLYDPDQGKIYLDGVDLKDINIESLHSQIGVVLQETFLFSGSILDNIRFAKPEATLPEIIQAAKAANAHDFICKTPDGYNTYVGEHGYNLSGGERQRIAIARAILNNPKLLILDEATSALDTESEFLIQQALNRLIKGRTTFAIAHRLSTLREANRLVVIDKHGIAEIGTHNELLEKKGIYYGLVTAQLMMAEGREAQVVE